MKRVSVKRVNVFRDFNGPAYFPVMHLDSGKRGPTGVVVGVIHGEEIIGAEVIHRLFKSLRLRRGSLWAIPVANTLGFHINNRFVPYGDIPSWGNLNRNFPGDPYGGPTERLAAAIYNQIVEVDPDFVVDIHADAHNSIPCILLDRDVRGTAKRLTRKTAELAEIFGVTVCNEDTLKGYISDDGPRSLTGALFNKARIPAFTLELGGPHTADEEFVKTGVAGVMNILAHFNMLNTKWSPRADATKFTPNYPLRTQVVFAHDESGKVSYRAKVGTTVVKEQIIAVIEDMFGRRIDEVRSPSDGYLLSLGYHVVPPPGTSIATLAVKDEEVK